MPFDFAWDARNSDPFVTDPSYADYLNSSFAYPTTFTNGDGLSINAGWDTTPTGANSIASGNDPRIAGYNYKTNDGTGATFKADLSSGSAPGAGNYTVDIALGAIDQALTQTAKLFDNTTLVDDLSNGGSGYARAVNHWVDANAGDITATTSWTGPTKSVTFATTTVKLLIGGDNIGSVTCLAHFRLTLQEAGGTNTDITPPSAVRLV